MAVQPLTIHEQAQIVRLAPLVSIDLIIRDRNHHVLLGLRSNAPARQFYFVPGGRIWKGERLAEAFAQISKVETQCELSLGNARLLGVHDHIYSDNAFGESGYGTHYVAIGYEVQIPDGMHIQADDQHSNFCWMSKSELLQSPAVHSYTKAYFGRP